MSIRIDGWLAIGWSGRDGRSVEQIIPLAFPTQKT
jgi:hypothetical protein